MNRHLRLVSNTSKTRASIIIVTRNSSETLRPCLDSVLRCLEKDDEVIVVDNASTDGTVDLAEEIFVGASLDPASSLPKRLHILEQPHNLGFGRAANIGIKSANGDSFVFLSPDVIVTTHWVSRMTDYLQGDRVGAVGPLIDLANGPQNASIFLPERQVLEARAWEPWDDQPDSVSESVTFDGPESIAALAFNKYRERGCEELLLQTTCLMLPRETIEEVGEFDEGIFLGAEDLEMSWRIQNHGLRLIVAADTFVSGKGDPYFENLPKEQAMYLSQLATNRLTEKLVGHYLSRGENPPGPKDLWDIDVFRPSSQQVKVIVVTHDDADAQTTVDDLTSKSVVPLDFRVADPKITSIFDLLNSQKGICVVIEAGLSLNAGWMSRIAAAGDIATPPAVFLPSYIGALEAEPYEHGLRPARRPEAPGCLIFSSGQSKADPDIAGTGGDWKTAISEHVAALMEDGCQMIEIADLKAKRLQ